MKAAVLSLLILILFSPEFFAQVNKKDGREKIEALEKLKLIEVLKMDEETSVKFFTRRNEHQGKMKDLFRELDSKRENIKNKLSAVSDDNDAELKKLIDSYFITHQRLDDEKKRFINSLSDILTYKQIAELTLFEKRFREEIRDVLYPKMKRRMRD